MSKVTIQSFNGKKWSTVICNQEKLPISRNILVNPNFADDVLKNRNPNNRHRDDRRVAKYAQDILLNNWHMTNDDICFDIHGNLMNGQHRLAAVVLSQRPAMMSFKFGVATASMV